MKFLDAIANVFRIPDLRKRVLFTLGLLAVYRLGGHIPIPGINMIRWDEIFSRQAGGIFGFFDMFAGGNIRRLTIFALGDAISHRSAGDDSVFHRRPRPAGDGG